jgi:hypothetical protein
MSVQCTAFEGARLIATGDLLSVALKAKKVIDRGERGPVLIFDDLSSDLIEVDFRGTEADVRQRLSPGESPGQPANNIPRGPGRPKLGVVAREVTLLPRHWEWLNRQPGGASVALRKLVEEARRANQGKDLLRAAQEAAYKFLSAMAGNEPGYEEALRALFGHNETRFHEMVEAWPPAVRKHATKLAAVAFAARPVS